MQIDPLMGQKFGFLTMVAPATETKRGSPRFFARCDCGKELLVYRRLMEGPSPAKSCGCAGKTPWTEEELRVIRDHYGEMGSACSAMIDRSAAHVRRKAAAIGIQFTGKFQRRGLWTEAEDQILRDHYPDGGSAVCLPLLPDRSKAAVQDRAYLLKIKCPTEKIQGHWSEEEREVIRKYYRDHGWQGVQTHLPHRSEDAIMNMVFAMRRESKQPWRLTAKTAWTKSEERELRKIYREGGSVAARKRWPDKSIDSIRSKASYLGLRYDHHLWTEEEVETLKRVFPDGGWKAVNKVLPHRTEGAINRACGKFDVKIRKWTAEEEAVMREHYPDNGVDFIRSLLPYYTRGRIKHKAHAMGLHSTKLWSPLEIRILKRDFHLGVEAIQARIPHKTLEAIRCKARGLGLQRQQPVLLTSDAA